MTDKPKTIPANKVVLVINGLKFKPGSMDPKAFGDPADFCSPADFGKDLDKEKKE